MHRVGRIGASVVAIIMGVAGCTAPDPATEPDDRETGPPSTAGDQSPTVPPQEAGVVVHVVDGDTFDVELSDGTVERIRPPQIDTPERDECGFDESTRAAENLLLGESVTLIPTSDGPDRDPHDRLLRAVDLHGDDYGEILVASGLARWSTHFADEDPALADRYAAAEDSARTDGQGFWSTCSW